MTPSEKKWSNGFLIAAFGFLAISLWQAYIPYMGRLSDVQAVRSSISEITPAELVQKLRREPHPPTMLLVYASWCGNCRVVMTYMAGVLHEHEYDDVRFIFISVDQNAAELMDYLIRNRYDGLFVPYLVQQHPQDTLVNAIASVGGRYADAIPYLMFFDRTGKMVKEFSGVASKTDIFNALQEAKK